MAYIRSMYSTISKLPLTYGQKMITGFPERLYIIGLTHLETTVYESNYD
jgi:hypothetical protein